MEFLNSQEGKPITQEFEEFASDKRKGLYWFQRYWNGKA